MRLVALCPLLVDGEKVAPGDSFDATDYSGAKLIARGAAKIPSRAKAKAKKPKAEPAAD